MKKMKRGNFSEMGFVVHLVFFATVLKALHFRNLQLLRLS